MMPEEFGPHTGTAFEDRLARGLDATAGVALAVLVFAMMALAFIDVLGRQTIDRPIPAGFEVTELMMAFTVYLGLPVVCARREHITIGLLDRLFKGHVKRVQHCVLNLLMAGLSTVWAREVWIQADALAAANELLMFLQIRTSMFVYAMSLLTAAAAAIFLALAWRSLRAPRGDVQG